MVRSLGQPDTGGGCEACAFAWALEFEVVASTCPDVVADTYIETFQFDVGLDYTNAIILVSSGEGWARLPSVYTFLGVNSAAYVLIDTEPLHVDTNANGVVDAGESKIIKTTNFVGLTWDAFDQTCGDGRCDFLEFGCDVDCPGGQQPASGFMFRAYDFQPQDDLFSACYRFDTLAMLSGEEPPGCDECTHTWAAEIQTIASDCGPWSSSVGTVSGIKLGAQNGDQLSLFKRRTGDWVRMTGTKDHCSEFRALATTASTEGFGDRNRDGDRDDDDPLRVTGFQAIIHY